MLAERLEVRLDPEHRRRLLEIAQCEGRPVSETVRRLIDEAYKEVDRERRMKAALAIGEMQIEDVPDPDELSRQLEETYDLGDLY